ncbi:hypothetical protein L204_104992 [Cryptococcus depauperatus]
MKKLPFHTSGMPQSSEYTSRDPYISQDTPKPASSQRSTPQELPDREMGETVWQERDSNYGGTVNDPWYQFSPTGAEGTNSGAHPYIYDPALLDMFNLDLTQNTYPLDSSVVMDPNQPPLEHYQNDPSQQESADPTTQYNPGDFPSEYPLNQNNPGNFPNKESERIRRPNQPRPGASMCAWSTQRNECRGRSGKKNWPIYIPPPAWRKPNPRVYLACWEGWPWTDRKVLE